MIITLISGKTVNTQDVSFDPGSYHFSAHGEDITNDIFRRDKLAMVADFDVSRDNLRVSRELGVGSVSSSGTPYQDNAPTSTAGALGDQILSDGVLGAPLETLDNTVGQVFGSTGIQTIIVTALIGFGVYLYVLKKL